MKKMLFLLFFVPSALLAQDIDAIIAQTKEALQTATIDSDRASLSSDLAWYYAQVSVDSALVYGKQALSLAQKIKNERLTAQAYNDLSTVYLIKGDYQTSLDQSSKALAIRQKLKDEAGVASIHFKMGNNYFKLSLFDSTMHHYFQALSFYEKQNDTAVATNLRSNISSTYYSMGNYTKALEYLNGPIDYFYKTEDYLPLSNCLLNFGNIQLSIKDTAAAFVAYEKAETYAKKVNNLSTLAAIYNNYANIYTNRNEFSVAIEYIQESIAIREELGLYSDLESSKLTLALNQFRMGDYESAKPKMLKLRQAFEAIEAKEKLKEIYLSLSYLYAYEKQTDSVSYYSKLYTRTTDELFAATTLKNSEEIEVKYQTEKKEKEILLQRAKLAEHQLYIFIVIGLLIVSLIAGYLIYLQQKMKNVQLQKENELKDALLKIETQNKLQEQRLRISRDLHDNIGAQLTFVISSIDNLKFAYANQQPVMEEKLTRISSFTRETISELRDTIWAMNKENISLDDLKSRISNFIDSAKLSSNGIDFSFTYNQDYLGESTFSSQDGMNIYRIIQEGINNAIKHAKATTIQVDVSEQASNIIVRIQDNGTGFNLTEIEEGNGLRSMNKRADELQGALTIKAVDPKGTLIELSLAKNK